MNVDGAGQEVVRAGTAVVSTVGCRSLQRLPAALFREPSKRAQRTRGARLPRARGDAAVALAAGPRCWSRSIASAPGRSETTSAFQVRARRCICWLRRRPFALGRARPQSSAVALADRAAVPAPLPSSVFLMLRSSRVCDRCRIGRADESAGRQRQVMPSAARVTPRSGMVSATSVQPGVVAHGAAGAANRHGCERSKGRR